MTLQATLTIEYEAPPEVLAMRDEMAKSADACRALAIDGVTVYGPDFHAWAKANGVCSSRLGRAQSELIAAAKKLGLKARGAPDVQFGVRGSFAGPVTLWYQIFAE